jgi:hypothetical protein
MRRAYFAPPPAAPPAAPPDAPPDVPLDELPEAPLFLSRFMLLLPADPAPELPLEPDAPVELPPLEPPSGEHATVPNASAAEAMAMLIVLMIMSAPSSGLVGLGLRPIDASSMPPLPFRSINLLHIFL